MAHCLVPPIDRKKMQSLVRLCSTIVVRSPTRRRNRHRSSSGVRLRCAAMSSISGLVAQIYPSPGPAQHPPHTKHSKCNPAAYHFVKALSLIALSYDY